MSEGQQIPAEASYHVVGAVSHAPLGHGASPFTPAPADIGIEAVAMLPRIESAPAESHNRAFDQGAGELKEHAGRGEPRKVPKARPARQPGQETN
jgi:hypothetical protein